MEEGSMEEILKYTISFIDFTGPAAIITLCAIWWYVAFKTNSYGKTEYIVWFPFLLKDYKAITKEGNGKTGILYYFFWFFISLTVVLALLELLSEIIYPGMYPIISGPESK